MEKWLIALGCILIATGVLYHFAPWLFTWFGKLPGDIRIDNERSKVFIPITSMILLSILLSVILAFFRR